MNRNEKLSDTVRKQIGDKKIASNSPALSSSLLEAMRLAELFDSVKPDEYILPLDALAGFINITKE